MGSYEQGFKYDNYTYDPYSGTSTPHLELPHEPPSRGLSRLGSWGFLDPLNILRVCSDFGGREGGGLWKTSIARSTPAAPRGSGLKEEPGSRNLGSLLGFLI